MSAFAVLAAALAVSISYTGAATAPLPDDAAMIEGFNKVVFGSEIPGLMSNAAYVRKFTGPVRFFIDDTANADRRPAVRRFVHDLEEDIEGLETRFVDSAAEADFIVHVVDRADYQATGRRIYHDPSMDVPGNCIVRSSYSKAGIRRSDALVVSDEGERLFRRCLIEEVLQGLGPLNENPDAPQSVFNDTSLLTSFTPYDRVIMNMLYDERLQAGTGKRAAQELLPALLRAARRRVMDEPLD